ncbi:MAG TPA: hypothetical protein VEB68_00290 [Croceibacterium sp.]|nr:hypothetical protein [Croceibacterium sp.]
MQGWAIMARALAGGAALAMAAAAPAQDAAIPRAQGYAALERLPDWSGVWNPDWSLLFGAGGGRAPVQPKLTPAAQQRLDAFRARQAAEGVDQSDQIHCVPPGMPGIMRQPYPMEILFTPGRVTIFAETYSQARRIYTDGRALPEDPDPYFNGNSVGRWDGDTLLVDTIGFSPVTDIAAGIAHGENMRIHERIWLEKPDVLRIETTITDPDVLAEPLVQQLAFRKQPDWQIREYVCEENNRLTAGENGANIELDLEFDPDDPFGPPPEE